MRTSWGDTIRARLGMIRGDIFTPAEVADILVVSRDKVATDIAAGLMPATDINAGKKRVCWRLTRSDIEEYIQRVEAEN